MEKDALRARAPDGLGHGETHAAQPVHAASIPAVTFATGAALPLAGGASMLKGSLRFTFWGAPGMALTAAVGSLFGGIF